MTTDTFEMQASGLPAAPRRTNIALLHFIRTVALRKGVFLEAILGTVVVNTLAVAVSMYTMQVYDRVVPTRGFATLKVLTIGVLLAALLELSLKHARALMVDRACKGIDLDLSAYFFGKAVNIRLDRRPRTIGTFAAQIRLYESVRSFMTSTSLFLLADIPFAFVFVGLIAWIAGPIAYVPLALVPIAIAIGLMFVKPIARLTDETMRESTIKNGLLIESVDGIETIKALGAEGRFSARWNALADTIGSNELRLKSLSNLSTHLAQLLQQLSYVGLVLVGVFAIAAGELTMGGLIACTIIGGRALAPIAQIPRVLVQWQNARIALKGLESIVQLPPDGPAEGATLRPQECRGELRVNEAHFAYDEDLGDVIDIEELIVRPGDRLVLIGPVGAGKSSLLKLLSGMYVPAQGRVFLDGIDMVQLDPQFVREHVAYLPQDARLFNGTLRDNLLLGRPDTSDEALIKAMQLTGLDQVVGRHPRGINLPISEGGHGLSVGQRQLVAITRLLLHRGKAVLMDEPTASLDGPNEANIMADLMAQFDADDTVVMATHRTSVVKHATRVVVLEQGRVVMDGPRDAVLARLMNTQSSDAA